MNWMFFNTDLYLQIFFKVAVVFNLLLNVCKTLSLTNFIFILFFFVPMFVPFNFRCQKFNRTQLIIAQVIAEKFLFLK
jgi:hypothetical protein